MNQFPSWRRPPPILDVASDGWIDTRSPFMRYGAHLYRPKHPPIIVHLGPDGPYQTLRFKRCRRCGRQKRSRESQRYSGCRRCDR